MSADVSTLRAHVRRVLLDRVAGTRGGRGEAIFELLRVTRPDITEDAAKLIAEAAPPLLPALYEKWIGLFADRLFETVPENQIALICEGGEENDAALALAYVMFLESERMERQIAEDLAGLNLGDSGEVVASLCAALAKAEAERQAAREEKAAGYRAAGSRLN